MKTKNNVQKAVLRSAAVVVSFVLISFTVSAQDFWKRLLENSSFNDIAMAMVSAPQRIESTPVPTESLKAIYFVDEVEPKMDVESWMTDFSSFDVNAFQFEEEAEAELELESWMLNENLFQEDDDAETSLELEAWMTSDKVWRI
ncbi:hypothetical protein OU798_10580 [Prolixibacteraceae bacterium Z1-6]|uniref:Uncharacterized protein n=1 Tax=Draconibacterium aestuarii TaxID=2998507 RepID=A0A9X3J6B7_9BACT|nr:hypothetical protein [Prolixibacteraceae bacterium Z1-6]